MTIEQAKQEVAKRLESEIPRQTNRAQRQVNFRLRDWGISAPALLGLPDPDHHCPKCDVVPVPDADLPVTLPEMRLSTDGHALDHHRPGSTSPAACGGKALRRDRHDGHLRDSSWYFARFTDPGTRPRRPRPLSPTG